MTLKPRLFSHLTLAAFALSLAPGCSYFSLEHHFQSKRTVFNERKLGTVSLTGLSDETAPKIHLVKVKKGYALKGHILREEDSAGDFVVSKSKEYDWFVGTQWKWTF